MEKILSLPLRVNLEEGRMKTDQCPENCGRRGDSVPGAV